MQHSNYLHPMMELPWTTEEHNLFLQGYLLYGKCWIEIAEVVRTRNAYQVCSYATWLESHGCLPRLPPIQNVAKNITPITTTTASTTASTTTTANPDTKANANANANATTVKKGAWSKEEHNLFLEALELYGRGKWSQIAAHVKTRNPSQIYSHEYYYFKKMEKNGGSVSGTKRKARDEEKPMAKKKLASASIKKEATLIQSRVTSDVIKSESAKTVTSNPKIEVEKKEDSSNYVKTEPSKKHGTVGDDTLDIHPPSIKTEDLGEAVVPPQVEKVEPLEEKEEAIADDTVAKESAVESEVSSGDVYEPRTSVHTLAMGLLALILLAGIALYFMGSEIGETILDVVPGGAEVDENIPEIYSSELDESIPEL